MDIRELTWASQLLYFQMNMLHVEVRMQAMIAENKQREIKGDSLAYSENDFLNLLDEYSVNANSFPFYCR